MDENQKTVELLRPVALAVARHIRDWHVAERGGDALMFSAPNWSHDGFQVEGWAGKGVIEYRVNHHADIQIVNLDVAGVDPKDIHVGPIEPVGPQELVRAHIMAVNNRLDTDIDRTITIKDLSSDVDSVANEVGVGVSLGFRQQLSYGGDLYGIGGETEITASVSAEYKRSWDTSRTRGFEIEGQRSFVEKAKHRTVFERVESVGPARQVITAKGRLTYGVRVHSSGVWIHTWPNIQSMLANWKGINSEADFFVDFYRGHPVPGADAHPAFAPVYATVEKVREFQNSTNVQVDIYNEPLA